MPVIVAESLEPVDDPLLTVLRLRERAPVEVVLGAMASTLAPLKDGRPAPDWLRSDQVEVFGRILSILQQYHGALLADPVGSGKTWVALAVAQAWGQPGPVLALVPAALIPQWERTAQRAGVAITVWSHEKLSRGMLPPELGTAPRHPRPLVIIDESHHFRTPGTRRYTELAPTLVGRSVLMLSATPVVNRLADLAYQLHLAIEDDALAPFGIPSFVRHLEAGCPAHSFLGELVLTRTETMAGKPVRVNGRTRPAGIEESKVEAHCQAIDRLELSRNRAVSGLIRGVLWRALASSPLALLAALRRYRLLLYHARDAIAAGKPLDRSALRHFAGGDEAQMVMWAVMPTMAATGDLVIDDLPMLDQLIALVREDCSIPDAKCRRLIDLVNDHTLTLVFVGARETVRFLRTHLAPASVAWCTGESAGIGSVHLGRDAVLSWFGPGRHDETGPRLLVTTDVTAEGLDLQGAARVIHYDLPWTAVRMDQRDGRALRLGSQHGQVDVIRFDPPPPVESRLAQLGVLARKRRLPRRAGLDAHGARTWMWREGVAARFKKMDIDVVGDSAQLSQEGLWCSVRSGFEGALAGFSIYTLDTSARSRSLTSVIGCLDLDGSWSEDPAKVDGWLATAAVAESTASGMGLPVVLPLLAGIIRSRLSGAERTRWAPRFWSPGNGRLISRLNQLAGRAVRARDGERLKILEKALAFAALGHTAGGERLIELTVQWSDAELLGWARGCPSPVRTAEPVYARLNGIVFFSKGD